ncbi:hypothetical protein [Yinghuangia soli]|uniref:Uncharacterized protein n=1 Tax=Yinghuangia soli TaxID=2908204 RepID=A0AA41Q557_9ACTN|nr:hypothetical protein [Yinghuangia soli]MCF2531769.1 hypothetical protein [Yinghuangia soli]
MPTACEVCASRLADTEVRDLAQDGRPVAMCAPCGITRLVAMNRARLRAASSDAQAA